MFKSYRIINGVDIPIRKRRNNYWTKMFDAISKLEVDDPVAVKVEFEDPRDIQRAAQRIYCDNRKNRSRGWNYSAMMQPAETAIYVWKVSQSDAEAPTRENGHRVRERA